MLFGVTELSAISNLLGTSLSDKLMTVSKFQTMAAATDSLGLDNAVANMKHHTGTPIHDKVESMLSDMRSPSTLSQTLLLDAAPIAVAIIRGHSGE